MDILYKEKYYKYKNKYLKLKKLIKIGGSIYKLILSDKNLKVYMKGDIIFLEDKEQYRLSEFNVKTFENYFSYAKNIIKIVDNYNYNLKKNKVLVLGFGIGGLPLKFTTYKDTDIVDSVDLDPNMYNLFNKIQKYLAEYPKEKMNNIIMSAEEYIIKTNKTNKKYDLIIDDVFGDDKIFLDYVGLAKILNKNGVLFINLHYMSDYKKLEPILKNNFSSVDLIKDNEILVICKK